MTGFIAKPINDRSLGDELRERRVALGQTIEDVERATRISKKYLIAIEANDLTKLPDLVYARGFVRALAAHYGLNASAYAKSLTEELSATNGQTFRHPAAFVEGRTLMVTPRIFKAAILAVVFLTIAGYFALSVRRILTPPTLTVYSPTDGQVFASTQVRLQGISEPEVDLNVNGEFVAVEIDGTFSDTLDLPPGVSNLRITARKKHSRENEVLMRVIVELPPVESATTTPATGSSSSTELLPF